MLPDLKPWQIVNHCLKVGMLTTKVGLTNSLKELKWWSSLPMDTFFPRSYDLTYDQNIIKEVDEFKEDFRVTRAEAILKKYVKKKEFQAVEKLIIAIHINEKRLADSDDLIDDPELENLVREEEWPFIVKDKWSDSQRNELFATTWYPKIQQKYQHLCDGELINSVHNTDSEVEEESKESD